MSYIEKNLMSGENVVYQSKLHWVIFLWPVFFILISIPFFTAEIVIGGIFLILTALLAGISFFIKYSTSEFGITNKRVIVKTGLIRRNSLEVLLNKIEGIQVNQGILGRILNYGSITISGTGGTKDPFHGITNPLEFRKKAQEMITSVQ